LQAKRTAMGASRWQAAFLARHRLSDSYLDYAQQWFTPLARRLEKHQSSAGRPVLVAVNGSQGSGKTTVCDFLRQSLEHEHGLRAVSLSLDDFYLTLAQRRQQASAIHPLLLTRGVPGTHDMTLLQATLDELLNPAMDRVSIPRFNKAMDDRRARDEWDIVSGSLDIVLLEGWCLGVRSQAPEELEAPINDLERSEDADGRWRQHVNQQIRQEFEPLYRQVDQWVMLCAPSFDCVYKWRLQQEHKLARQHAGGNSRVMSDGQVARFIQFYERLTRQCLSQLPARVDHLYRLDDERQVTAELHTGSQAS
jgi:D-glycerate 3-kinase